MKKLAQYNDEYLLKAIANNDEKAFEEIFNRYWKMAHRMAMASLKSQELTQEIVQDIFLNFWERRHSLHIKNFSNYLAVSVKYKVIDFIKHQVIEKKYNEYYKIFVKLEEEETLKAIEYNDLRKALEEGVQTLPEKTQNVFRLNRMEGHSVAEIANLLNLSEKAIQYHLTRSVRELRLYLKDFLIILLIILFP